MRQASTDQIIRLADMYAAHRNLSHWRVSFLMRGNGKFIDNLRTGKTKTCTLTTYEKCMAWAVENWPEDLEWPRDIPRPIPVDVTSRGDAA